LLRALQDGDCFKLGSGKRQKADVRTIAATNDDLEVLIGKKKFRKDLYCRIKGRWLHLPAVDQRKEDIELFSDHFIAQAGLEPAAHQITAQARRLLAAYPFPGNVRELQSIIAMALNRASERIARRLRRSWRANFK
jgi:transcriptional regulator with PAS, ATPase and Fis domain